MTIPIRQILSAGVASFALLGAAQNVLAQNAWNVESGDWNTPQNWLFEMVPTEEFVAITNGGTATISSSVPSIFGLVVGGDLSGKVLQTGGTLTVSGGISIQGSSDGSAGSSYAISSGAFVHDSGGDIAIGAADLNSEISNSLTISGTASFSSSAGRFLVGGGNSIADNTLNVQGGTFSNTAGDDFLVGSGGGKGTINVSGGSVTILSNFLGIGHTGSTSNGTINVSGGTFLKGTGGNINLGQGGTGSVGVINVSGGTFSSGTDIRLGDSNGGTGHFTLSGDGTLVSTAAIIVGSSTLGTGTFTQNGGTLTKTSGDVLIGDGTSSSGIWTQNAGTANVTWVHVGQALGGDGILNMNGGTFTASNDIEVGVNGSTGTVNLNGGTISANIFHAQGTGAKINFNGSTMKAKISTADFFLGFNEDQLLIKEGGFILDTGELILTVANVLKADPSLDDADGGVTKVGAGTLILSGANVYEGKTQILEGTLSITSGFVTGDVYLNSLGIFDLNFSGIDNINAFYIDGVAQAIGTWGAVGVEGVDFTSPYLTGTGVLNVTSVPEPGVSALAITGALVAFGIKRRRSAR